MAEEERDDQSQNQGDNMNATLADAATDEGFWREMWRQARLAWYLIRSPEVPLYLKLLPALAIIYVLLPTDFLPDVFPVIGQLDDITALLVGAKVFIELAPQEVVAHYMRTVRQGMANAAGRRAQDQADEGVAEQDQSDVEKLIVIEGEFDLVEAEKDQAD
jgi:uncharacterized membrane protein YkvA (DUF1232 family)